jgi:hypothetical protein
VATSLATAGTKRAEVRSTSVKERIQRSVAARRGEVVLRRDLVRFGSAAQISRALKQLIAENRLVRIGADAALQGQAAGLAVGRKRLPDYAE